MLSLQRACIVIFVSAATAVLIGNAACADGGTCLRNSDCPTDDECNRGKCKLKPVPLGDAGGTGGSSGASAVTGGSSSTDLDAGDASDAALASDTGSGGSA